MFIALVKERRGTRLKGGEDELFSGEFWAGERAVALGLADAIGDLRGVLRARFGDKVVTPVVAPQGGLLALLGRRSRADAVNGLPDAALSALEARALWARYGL